MNKTKANRGGTRAWLMVVAAATVLACSYDHLRQARDEPQLRPQTYGAADGASGGTVAERTAALDALAYAVPVGSGKDDYVSSTLVQALVGPDEQIRGQALATFKDAAEDLPVQPVAQPARDDPSPALRIQAFELLVERSGEEALQPLRLALADPEAAVHDRARELIVDLHLAFEAY